MSYIAKPIWRIYVLLFLPLTLILYFVSIFTPIKFRVGTINRTRFGHLLNNTELYLASRTCSKDFFLDFPFFDRDYSVNQFVESLIVKQIKLYPRFLVYPLWAWSTKLNLTRLLIPELSKMPSDNSHVLSSSTPFLSISTHDLKLAEYELFSTGFNPDQPWICLYVRSNNYLKATNRHIYTNYQAQNDSIRNSDISVIFPSLDYLIHANQNIVLMGKMLPQQHVARIRQKYGNRVFIPDQHQLSERAEIFLGSQCMFFLGSPSGAENVADVLGRRPVSSFNIPNIGSALFSGKRMYTFCRVFSPSLGRNLSLSEMFSFGTIYYGDSGQYDQAGLVPVQNDDDDVLLLLKDSLSQLESGWTGFGRDSLSEAVRSTIPLKYSSWAYEINTFKISSFPSERFLRKHHAELFPDFQLE